MEGRLSSLIHRSSLLYLLNHDLKRRASLFGKAVVLSSGPDAQIGFPSPKSVAPTPTTSKTLGPLLAPAGEGA